VPDVAKAGNTISPYTELKLSIRYISMAFSCAKAQRHLMVNTVHNWFLSTIIVASNACYRVLYSPHTMHVIALSHPGWPLAWILGWRLMRWSGS
jgi:hypothetical protein